MKDSIDKAIELSFIEKDNAPKDLHIRIENVLKYIANINKIDTTKIKEVPKNINNLREDKVTNKKKEYSADMISQAKEKYKDYIVSKKIL